uniref:Uncharacterized protein n=2 Tax=Oryza punctata TaxID=4537 RepID=A0A0E0K361_ORYPU
MAQYLHPLLQGKERVTLCPCRRRRRFIPTPKARNLNSGFQPSPDSNQVSGMASTCFRVAARMASSACRSAASRSIPSAGRTAARSGAPRISRLPVELGCCAGLSLLPLHSAVAAARLTSRLSTASRSCCALSQGTLCRTYPGL